MSSKTLHLFDLPSEIRNYIWTLALGNLTVTLATRDNFTSSDCNPCRNETDLPDRLNSVIKPLRTCKQIQTEATPIFYSTLTLVLSTYQSLDRLHNLRSTLFNQHRNLILYMHLNDDNRVEWADSVHIFFKDAPQLVNVTMHAHMRPPMSYEHLIDGLFFAVPLISLPSRITTTLKFDYVFEDVMFASPYVGEIRCSDALEEHELVIRDLLVDQEFCAAARSWNLEVMTGILVRIARKHEQPWFAKLQRRRLQELERLEQQEANGEGSTEQVGA